MNDSSLASTLRRIVLSVATSAQLVSVGCASTVTPGDAVDGAADDASTRPDAPPVEDAAALDVALAPRDASPVEDAARFDVARDIRDARPPIEAGPCGPNIVWQGTCGARLTWTCDPPPELLDPTDPSLPDSVCEQYCPTPDPPPSYVYRYCGAYREDGGATSLQCGYCASGRRTEGLVEPALRAPENLVGEFLANCATLERASVTAFERLREALSAHGAPDDLLAALSLAADEERDHTDRMTAAALAWGVRPEAPRFSDVAGRSLAAIARENAVEGCVRETWGALVAAWQSSNARDAALASLFDQIADDEARHAALSWRMHAWFAPRLDDRERAAVDAARDRAIAELEDDAWVRTPPALVRAAGLPDAAEKRALLGALRDALWS